MKTAYLIEPRVAKRWFRNNQVMYDLVKYTEEDTHLEYFPQKTIKTIFSSQDIEQLITIKQNLER